MDIQAAKLDLLQKLMNVSDASLLDEVRKLLDKNMVVGYTVDGKPLNRKQYDARLALAEEQIAKGQSITQEDLEREVENWS